MFLKLDKPLNFKGLKKSHGIAAPILATTAASSYSIYKYASPVSSQEHNYLARVHLSSPTSSTTSVHGKSVNYADDASLLELVKSDQQRLTKFYRSYNSKPISVSVDRFPTKEKVDFFVHLRDKNPQENLNNFGLENVHLNQISIDRYGYEYDDKGLKKPDVDAKIRSIIKGQDIELDNVTMEDDIKKLPSISFRFFNTNIPKSEVEILINEDASKYTLDANSDKDVSLDGFVWLDKSLLTLKMNYALQTYVFNQSGAQSENAIMQIIGDNNANNDQKQKKQAANENYQHLPEAYKKFAESYLTTFIDTSASNPSSTNGSQAINHVTSKESFIKTDDINKIYNRFKSQNKDLGLFSSHLMTKITAGATGNWKLSLNLEKTDAAEESKEQEEKKPKHEARDITALSSGGSESAEERKKNLIHIVPDVLTNATFQIREIFDRVKKYSVRNFVFNDAPEFISSVYSSSTDAAQKEAIKLISFTHTNEFGLYKNEQGIPIILAAIFLVGVLSYLIIAFKGPGAIMGAAIVASTVNVGGLFFCLGSKLSLIGVFASFVGLFYTLFLGYYLLSFLRKIFDIEFLDPSNVWAVFKRGLVMLTDVSLPFFVYSTFITFLAPIYLREFGIVLALFTLCSYVFVGIAGCLMSIGKAVGTFVGLGNYFRAKVREQDFYLRICQRICDYRRSGIVIVSLVSTVLLAAITIFCLLGFNSFSFFKDNFLVISNPPSNHGNITSNLGQYVTMGSQNPIYLAKDLASDKMSSLKNSAIISETSAFSDIFSMGDLAFSLCCSFALILFYVFIRFGFTKVVILLINALVSFSLFISVFLISRIFTSASIAIAICSFFALSILYNIFSFGLEKKKAVSWYAPLVQEIKHDMFSKITGTTLGLVAVLSLTAFSSFGMPAIYVGIAVICIHLFSNFFYQFLASKLPYIQNLYLGKSVHPSSNEKSAHQSLEEECLDPYDEELIEGINKRIEGIK